MHKPPCWSLGGGEILVEVVLYLTLGSKVQCWSHLFSIFTVNSCKFSDSKMPSKDLVFQLSIPYWIISINGFGVWLKNLQQKESRGHNLQFVLITNLLAVGPGKELSSSSLGRCSKGNLSLYGSKANVADKVQDTSSTFPVVFALEKNAKPRNQEKANHTHGPCANETTSTSFGLKCSCP